MKIFPAILIGAALCASSLPAHAVVLDLSTMSCKQFVDGSPDEIKMVLTWMDGWYKGDSDEAIIDTDVFVENAKKNHVSRITFSRAGVGSTPDFVAAMVKQETGLPIQMISYKSGSEGVTAVIGNQVDMTSEASIVTLPLIKGGKLKALATTWGGRLASAPEIPTAAEEGFPNIRIGHWEGMFAPTGTPPTILDKMNAAILQAAKNPEVLDALKKTSIEPGDYTRAQFTKFTKDEYTRLGKVVKAGHMHAE